MDSEIVYLAISNKYILYMRHTSSLNVERKEIRYCEMIEIHFSKKLSMFVARICLMCRRAMKQAKYAENCQS
jgi:hypothetical protein